MQQCEAQVARAIQEVQNSCALPLLKRQRPTMWLQSKRQKTATALLESMLSNSHTERAF